MYYTANTSFTSTNGHIYQFGEVATSYDFNRLPIGEQFNFTEHAGEISTAVADTMEDASTLYSSLQEDDNSDQMSTSSDSDSFQGFDGGESGGAGASGDF